MSLESVSEAKRRRSSTNLRSKGGFGGIGCENDSSQVSFPGIKPFLEKDAHLQGKKNTHMEALGCRVLTPVHGEWRRRAEVIE